MARYTVQKGETSRDVARRFTGDESRYRDLLHLNPKLRIVTGQMGAPEADPRDWNEGMVVQIPDRWISEQGMLGAPIKPGLVGASVINTNTPRTGFRRDLPSRDIRAIRATPYRDIRAIRATPYRDIRAIRATPYRDIRANPYGYMARPPMGSVGQEGDPPGPNEAGSGWRADEPASSTCSPGVISEVKDYTYVVRGEDGWPDKFAQAWFQSAGEQGRYTSKATMDLLKANHDHPIGFKKEGTICNFKNFYDGMCLKIPASWPNPKPDSPYAERIYELDCTTPYKGTSGGGGTGPGSQGETGIDPVNWLGGGDGDSSTVLLVLAAAAAVGGGILLYNAKKKKRR